MALHPNCTLLGVVGGKGGVGKSLFAANLACALLAELRVKVLLIDADSRSVGDQNVITGLKPQKILKDLAQFTGSFAQATPQQFVTAHASGFSYVGAVRGPDEKIDVSPEGLLKALDFISRHYQFIVVDLGNDIGPLQLSILQEATACMVVTTPEILVITQTQRLLNEMFSATFPKDMFQLVINKASSAGVSPQAISAQLQMPVVGAIPQDDMTAMSSLQRFTPFVLSHPKSPISAAYTDTVRRLTGGVIQRLKSLNKPKISAPPAPSQNSVGAKLDVDASSDPRTLLKLRIHNELIRTSDINKLLAEAKGDESKQQELKEKVKRDITLIVDKESPDTARDERSKLIKEVLEESLGLGPLEDLLADSAVSEIMVNGAKRIFVEKSGKVQLSQTTFTSNDHLRRIIERIVTPLGRQINNMIPYVDARLKDGSRVNAVIEPLAIDGPALTIRKFKKGGVSPEKYVEYGSMNMNMIGFLKICVENGLNVIISGGTGSGKTTLLNMLSSFIPSNERIITVEDAAELQLQQEHVVRLETRPGAGDNSNAITIRDLIRNSLRMRPDRIVVGECRDGAALDMLQAMNTGHDGSMTTTHANTPRECISRIETLCMMAGMDLPAKAIREQIASAVNLIVQVSRLSDGSRKILSITEVTGIQGEAISLGEIFRFKETGYDKNRKILGQFQATGYIPSFLQKLSDKGVLVPRDLFSNEQKAAGPAGANANVATHQTTTPGTATVPPVKKTG
jgi:pilus assembly protein CpaF